jgi:WD40 repeat protein
MIIFFKILYGHKEEISPLLEINNNLLVSASFHEKIIKFWNLDNYSNICTIECFCSGWAETILLYNKKYLIIGGKGLYIVDLIQFKILNHFKIEDDRFIKFIKKINNKIYLTGDGTEIQKPGNLIQWKIINENEWIQEKLLEIHNLGINVINFLNDYNIMITGSNDFKIKIWRKKNCNIEK